MGATQNAKSRGIFAVEAELLAQRIRDRSASFLRNQHGGGDVPFVTPADSCDKVRLIGSHHRHPERDAVGLVHLCQVEIHLGQLVSGHTCACENLAAARYQRLAVADRKSTRLNSSHYCASRMPASACKKTHNTTSSNQT